MENELKFRLQKLIKSERLKQKEFCDIIEVSNNTLNTTFQRSKGLGSEILSQIANKFPQYSMNWLLTGEGEMLKSDSLNKTSFSVSEFKQRGYAPYYSDLQVSAGQYDLMLIEQNGEPGSWIKIPGMTVELFFPIIGCSMEPKIHAGDTIGVVSMERWDRLDPDKIYLIITIYDRMVKHLEVDETDKEIIWAVSENRSRIKIYVSEIQRIYRVVWTGRLV